VFVALLILLSLVIVMYDCMRMRETLVSEDWIVTLGSLWRWIWCGNCSYNLNLILTY